MAAAAAASTSNTLPMRVTRTARGISGVHQEQEGRPVSWRDVPSDLYGQILRRLPSCKDRVHLSAVCRHWRVCARQHLPRLPMRVTRTARGTHVRGISGVHQEQEGRPVSWRDLPSDLYGQILRRLPSCKDRVHLSAVCRHWHLCARQHLPRLPMRVTRTARGTHVVHVRGVSRLQEQQCVRGFVDSPAFAVAGLHWAIRIRYYPGPDGERGHVGVFVMLLTEGVVARAHVGLLLLDQTSGLPDTVIWDQRPTRFDAASADWCTRGTAKIATRSELIGSGFVRGDCLKIECVLDDVCRDPMLR